MRHTDPVVIVSAVRTPLGRFQGELSTLSGHALGTQAIRAAIARAGLAPDEINEVLMGCVLPAGQGQTAARQGAVEPGYRRYGGHHHQQGLRLGDEGRHARP